jgi:hypothetical protein
MKSALVSTIASAIVSDIHFDDTLSAVKRLLLCRCRGGITLLKCSFLFNNDALFTLHRHECNFYFKFVLKHLSGAKMCNINCGKGWKIAIF